MAQSRAGTRPRAPTQGDAILDRDFTIGARAAGDISCALHGRDPDEPVFRPLRIFALDPTASVLDGAVAVVNVPFEPVERRPQGPRGAILEIIDNTDDETCVDLDDPVLLMQQGHTPSPDDPRFRQQMLYAVCITTYAAFRQALGRDIGWSFRSSKQGEAFRLKVRPSVKDLQNAYYDRTRGELCFGEFTAGGLVVGRNVPGGSISLALSHDVVVHEMSHAMLDGLRAHFLTPTNNDVLAFHEAFADVVAIFQRFTYRDIVLAAIRKTRDALESAAVLTSIAVQFAQATYATDCLRSAVSGTNRNYEDTVEPHQRGEILVIAVFEAFTTIYRRRTAPAVRLATGGSGLLPPGELSEPLAAALTDQACKLASHFLSICIRALDYCPPVDITFGEFLRALITADIDIVPDDSLDYREAWIDAFAKRRIYPANVSSLSESSLKWRSPEKHIPPEPALSFAELHFNGDPGRPAGLNEMRRQAIALGRLAATKAYRAEFGLCEPDDPALGGDTVALPMVESIRSSRRVGPSGQIIFDLVAEITQRRSVQPLKSIDGKTSPGFDFYGGSTVILDPYGKVRYIVRKSVLDGERLRRQREFLAGPGNMYFTQGPGGTLLPRPKLLLRVHDVTRPQLMTADRTRSILSELAKGHSNVSGGEYFLVAGARGPAVRLLRAALKLGTSDVYDTTTERAVSAFQSAQGTAVDGVVGPATWTAVGRSLNYNTAGLPVDDTVPPWISRLLCNDPRRCSLRSIEPSTAIEIYEVGFGPLSADQRDKLASLIERMAQDTTLTDLRHAAYMLATVKHECADTWRPVEEVGRGSGFAYGEPVAITDDTGARRQNAYYGRGYVQLTWIENYRRLGQALGIGNELVYTPALALDPAVAFAIMSVGMRAGLFTGRAIGTYIAGDKADYLNARRIVNGTDQALTIAKYAKRFETTLLASAPLN